MTKHGFTDSIDKQTSHLRTVLLEAVEEAYDTGYREALRDVIHEFDTGPGHSYGDPGAVVVRLAHRLGIDVFDTPAESEGK